MGWHRCRPGELWQLMRVAAAMTIVSMVWSSSTIIGVPSRDYLRALSCVCAVPTGSWAVG